jgi:hypothetical protein
MKTLITFIKKTPDFGGVMEVGYANGYVIIPERHPLHGKDYDDINEHVNIHGGLTFSEAIEEIDWPEIPADAPKNGWVVGFDTCHFGDNPYNWSKEAVLKETERLKKQLENYYENNN